MKKLNQMEESRFLKLFFLCMSLCFVVAAFIMPDRADILGGMKNILLLPCKVSTNYFGLGGYAVTFLNMGLVGL